MAQLLIIDDLPIRLLANGTWCHGDKPLHPKVAALFARSTEVVGNKAYRLVVGHQKVMVEVEDVAFFVRYVEMTTGEEGGISEVVLNLSDGKVEVLRPESFMMSGENVLYCQLFRSGYAVPCRFRATDYYQLALTAELVGDDAEIKIGGEVYVMNRPYDGDCHLLAP
ncbi:MAG: hypothetical protein VYA34_01355 [Myxococcota bacterium]|nr:hypothetical protein [Myxococcota bacterium]